MKFVCLLPVCDEGDIVAQCLDHLLSWSDAVYVFDTGSTDNTWDTVQDYAGRERRIHLLGQRRVFFSEKLVRAWMFHEARKTLITGDWFLRVDADEFHHIPPPEFVKTRMKPHETIAYHQYYNFAMRTSDVADWEAGRVTLEDRKRPIEERRRWFTLSRYSEPRLCRYRESMKWPPTVSFPFNAGFVAEERLPIRHYPHRDPAQMERRCKLRHAMMMDKANRDHWRGLAYHEWEEEDWRTFVLPDDSSDLHCWEPGTELVASPHRNHIKTGPKRWVQRALHASCLPLLDAMRPAWPDGEDVLASAER